MVDYKKMLSIITKVGIVVVFALLLYFVGLPIIELLAPFILAGIIAFLIEPLVTFFETKLKIRRKIASLLSLLSFLIVFGTLISLAIYKIIIELAKLSYSLPGYFKNIDINNEILYWKNFGTGIYLKVPPESALLIQDRLNKTIADISAYATQFVTSILTFMLNFIKVFPETFIFIIITIISIYFISSDREKIRNFILKQFPESWASKLSGLKNDIFFALIGFIKAQLMLITVTFIIASIGLSIIGIEYAVTLAIIIGIAELIPVVGTGSIFIPWIIVEAFSNNPSIAVWLAVIFVLGVVVRQVIEPKIIGTQIGMYPLVALISIYVGLGLFGVFGMILGPIIIILLRSLNKSGLIHMWKE